MSHNVGQLTIIFARRKETGIIRRSICPTRPSPLQSWTLSSKNSSTRQKPFSDIWGLRLDKYQVHARFILLDTVTGYRSQYQQGAFCISV